MIDIWNGLLSASVGDEAVDAVVELVGGGGVVDEPPLLRLEAGQELPGEHQLLRPALAQDAGQPVDRPGAAEERAPHVEVADQGVVRGDREVAVDHDLEATGGRVALEHRDRRLRRAEDPVADAGRALRDLPRPRAADEVALELVEIEARAERAVAAAEDHDADLGVGLRPAHGLVELLEKLLADGVLLVRAVEPDAGDVTVDLVLDRLDLDSDRHANPPLS